ncbi:MAG: glycosyltransferase family 39 protein [Alphaproteobacteria bacterium]|nr:glycosyltransferase family 39 protein [Alphaproteobacteria bacterium]
MKDFIKKQLSDFDNNSMMRLFKILISASLLVIVYGLIFSGFQIVDEFEHLHASFLVSQGKLPYRDFFEHHHPLLWYVSAPIVGLFFDNVAIFYIMRVFSFLASIGILFYLYKISLFFTNKIGGLAVIAFYLCNIITAYNFYQFRPDVFMNLFFGMGIYYWFCHIKDKKLKPLIISFSCFGVSVLFLQKIGLLLIVIEALLLWLIFTKRMKLKDIIIAAIFPCILLLVLVMFFATQNAFVEYFALNFRFNNALVYYFDRGAFWYPNICKTIYALGLLVGLYFYKRENIYFKIITILYCAEFIMRGFYFAPHPNYYTLLIALYSLIIATILPKTFNTNKLLSIIIILGLFYGLGLVFNRIAATSEKSNSFEHYKMAKFIHNNSNKDDIIMNGFDKNFNIYRKDASYYWFGLDMLIPVMEQEFGIKNLVDVNTTILNNTPKFIYTKNHVDLRALRMYGEAKYSQVYNPNLLNKYYKKTPYEYLFELK